MKKLLLLCILSFPLASVGDEDASEVDLSVTRMDCECDCQTGIVQRIKKFFNSDEEEVKLSRSACEDLAQEFNELQAACELDKLAEKPAEQESCNRLIEEKLAALEQCKK